MRFLKVITLIFLCMLLTETTAFGNGKVVEKYNMRRMDVAKEQRVKELYQIEKEDIQTINKRPKIEAFDVSEKMIVLALDDNSIIKYDLNMKPIARYTYKGNTNVEGVQIYGSTIYVFFVRYEECFVLENDDIRVYEWTNESSMNDAANEVTYDEKTTNDSLYYLSTKGKEKKNSLNGRYVFFICVGGNGQSEVLYEADKGSDNFSFANIKEPLLIAVILIINLLLFGLIRRKA